MTLWKALVFLGPLFEIAQVLHGFEFFVTDNCPDEGKDSMGETGTIRVMTVALAPATSMQWNSTSRAVNYTGFSPYVMHLISQRLGRSYCWVNMGKLLPIDDTRGVKGLISYLAEGRGDLLIGTLLQTNERFKSIDFTVPMIETTMGIMIPLPNKEINKNAMGQPFRLEVWMNVIAAVVVVIFALYASSFMVRRVDEKRRVVIVGNRTNVTLNDAFTYVVTVLLSQGNVFANQKTACRMVAGVWCLAALILGSAYTGVLLSFIMSPVSRPVVNSFYDIARVPGLEIAVDRGKATDVLFQTSSRVNSAIARTTQNRMYRCETSADCVEKVADGHHVYIHARSAIEQTIATDVAEVGRCRFTLAKETFWRGFLSWGMPKRAPLNDKINKAVLELDAFGLSSHWRDEFARVPTECVRPAEPLRLRQLSLSHLSGPFALLGLGLGLAVAVFLAETILHRSKALKIASL